MASHRTVVEECTSGLRAAEAAEAAARAEVAAGQAAAAAAEKDARAAEAEARQGNAAILRLQGDLARAVQSSQGALARQGDGSVCNAAMISVIVSGRGWRARQL